jgi:DNA repair exonuclease SbcCD nuclease subunit
MKLIAFGDLHAHAFTDFAEKHPKYINTRFEKILGTIDHMIDYSLKNKIEYILFAGDMFHQRVKVDQTVRNLVYNKLKKASDNGLQVIAIPGNHDQVDNTDFPHHALHEFRDITNVTVLDGFEEFLLEEDDDGEYVVLFTVPYSKNVQLVKDRINGFVKGIKKDKVKHSILLGHLGISGATVGKSSYAMQDAFGLGDLYPEVFQFGIFGHYHKRQLLGKHKHFAYTGSPLPHNFNDVGDFGFIEIDTIENTLEFKNIDSPKFITVTDPEQNVDELEGHYVRFQIPAESVERVSEKLPEELQHRMEPQKEYKEDKRVEIDHSMSEVEVVKGYCKEFNPEAEDIMLEILREVL